MILADLRPSVLIKTTRLAPGDPVPIGRSRLGGDPDLPPGHQWPTFGGRPLTLLAQIRLSELPDMPPTDAAAFALPRCGLLWFWYDEVGDEWSSTYGQTDAPFRVTFCADESAPLMRMPTPPGVHRHHACSVSLRRVVSVPRLEYDHQDELLRSFDRRNEIEADTGANTHRLRGHHSTLYRDQDRGRPADAELLFHLGEDMQGPGWMWGDAGSMSFWIRRCDLDRCDFSRVWATIECG